MMEISNDYCFKPSWCECDKCWQMPKQQDRLCCVEATSFTCGEATCVTVTLQDDIKKILRSVSKETNSDRRHEAYCGVSQLLPGYTERKTLPSCVVWKIRCQYPDEKGEYTGFPPNEELLPFAVDAHKKYGEKFQQHEKTVMIVDNENGLIPALRNFVDKRLDQLNAKTNADTLVLDPVIQWLPKMGIIAIVSAMQSYIKEIMRDCLDVVHQKAIADEKDIRKWLKNRRNKFQRAVIAESDKKFWEEFFGKDEDKKDKETIVSYLSGLEATSENDLKSAIYKAKKQAEDGMIALSAASTVCFNIKVLNYRNKHMLSTLDGPTWYSTKEMFMKIMSVSEKGSQVNEQSVIKQIKYWSGQHTWEIQLSQEEKLEKYTVKSTDYTTLCHLSNLFYGFRNVIAHSSAHVTLNIGVMRACLAPKDSSDLLIEVVPEDSGKSKFVAQYLFDKWDEVKRTPEDGNMNIDYHFFSTMRSFYYDCMLQTVGEVGACIAHSFSSEQLKKDATTVFGIDVKDLIPVQ